MKLTVKNKFTLSTSFQHKKNYICYLYRITETEIYEKSYRRISCEDLIEPYSKSYHNKSKIR